jgi:hypothetical protein
MSCNDRLTLHSLEKAKLRYVVPATVLAADKEMRKLSLYSRIARYRDSKRNQDVVFLLWFMNRHKSKIPVDKIYAFVNIRKPNKDEYVSAHVPRV